MKHLQKKLNSLENEKRLLSKTSEELMRRYGKQKKVAGSSMRKLVEKRSYAFYLDDNEFQKAYSKLAFGTQF